MARPVALAFGLAVLLAGCGSTAPTPQIIYVTPAPTATPVPATPAPERTPAPTPAPATPMPIPTAIPTPTTEATPSPPPRGNLVRSAKVLKKWSVGPFIRAQVIVRVENSGGGWVRLSSLDSDFTIYASDGSVSATGDLIYTSPPFIRPGGTGYIFGDMIEQNGTLKSLARAEVNVAYEPVDRPDQSFAISMVRRRQESSFGSWEVTGIIKNTGAETAGFMIATVIFLGKDDSILGADWANVDNLRPGQSKGFTSTSNAS
jgi:hypothetical protein